ncbi:hypothetical protein K7W42_16180 [Deinococcus sp. HMF7604]|uniref:hypothetical protein n=1 Tax=Deinococcus betulae TaxID=2873312 RepID=UPI001CCE890E|nr:hypothetical protein [Deinococcus betulae]MBZ9752390.1 hypothetical protein [Deinococcus betulae]
MTYKQKFAGATAFLRLPEKMAQLDAEERHYKRRGAAATRDALESFLRGETEEPNIQIELNLLDWRMKDDLSSMFIHHPKLFREALTALWADQITFKGADLFWSIIDPALNVLPATHQKRFASLNARTSVVSYFLFVANPQHHPFYRASFSAKAIQALYDKSEGLDRRTISGLLQDFVGRCKHVQALWQEEGLPLEDMLDTQSALYILAQEHFKG